MNLMLSILILISCTSCSLKNTKASSSLQIDNFLNQPFPKIQQAYPDLEKEGLTSISGKTYTTWSLIKNGQPKIQVLTNPTTDLTIEIVQFPNETTLIDKKEYPDTYKPKCESNSTTIKYNTKSNRVALEKNETIIFHGRSLLIQDRINDDKSKKCLNRWGH